MNIRFYYIPGISEIDTPVFDTLTDQESFFADCEHLTVEAGFYPPFLKNTIMIDISNYNLTTTIYNYCSLEFNNKHFYYFILSKEYVNESVVKLTIKMDTIQTYMFDVRFINAFIERRSVSRFVRDAYGHPTAQINRDYIRENISKGSFTKIDLYQELNTGTSNDDNKNTIWNWVYVAKFASNVPGSGNTDASRRIRYAINNEMKFAYVSPFDYGVCPLYATAVLKQDTSYIINGSTISKLGATQDRIVDAYLIPFASFENLSAINNSDYSITQSETVQQIDSNVTDSNLIFFGGDITAYINTGFYNIMPTQTYTLGSLFNPFKVPAMLDENYIKFTLGDPSVRTEYPLYNLTVNSIRTAYWADITTGARYYNLYDRYGNPNDNQYDTIVVNSAALKLDLKNSPWENYIANNRATLLGSTSISLTNLLGSMGSGYIRGGPAGGVAGLVTGAVGVTNNQIKYKTNELNKKNAPESIKRLGQVGTDLFGGEEIISLRRYYCDDFKEVAIFYESYGYKVSYMTRSNLFALHERVFYDYVLTNELNVMLGDKASEEDFIRRFNQGIRMWHTYPNTASLVCWDYDLELGQLCVLDNVEYYEGILS